MKIIIVGCSRLGMGLAVDLSLEGNEVTLIGENEEDVKGLDPIYRGDLKFGVEFDKDLLEEAGIERADSLICCTNYDVKNALVARIARNIYKVPKVVARLYDPRKAAIYNALGIQIIGITNWEIARARELLISSHLESAMSIGNTPIEVIRLEVTHLMDGYRLSEIFPLNEVRVVALSRDNSSFIPQNSTQLSQGDVLYLAVTPDSLEKIRHIMAV